MCAVPSVFSWKRRWLGSRCGQRYVDGLVNPVLTNCLLMALVEAKTVWSNSEAASRLYLNYFFQSR